MSRKAQRKKAEAVRPAAKRPAPTDPRRLWFLLLAAAVPLLLYWPTTGYGFLLDDFVLFQNSPSLSDLGSIPHGFTTDVGALRKGGDTVISSYYRPVFLALSTVYYKLFGGGPASWHAASTMIAALIGALACGFFLRLGFSPPLALLGSLVFSLHPAHVSSVAWASGLQELLAALFVGCALHMILTARREDRDPRPLVWAALFYALGLLSKEVAIALLPFVALWALLERKSDPQGSRRLWKAAAVLAGVAVVYLAVRVAVLGGLAVPPENAPGFRAALSSVPVALATYLRLLVLPVGFSIFRPERPVYGLLSAPVLLAVAALVVLAASSLWAIRKRRELALPLAWLVVWLLPVLNLWALDPQWMVTDRYLFLPSLALPWALLVLLPERARTVTLSVLAAAFALLTLRYSAIFHDERSFLAAMEKAEPTSPLVFAEKGRLLMQDGNLSGARTALTRAVELDPIAPGALTSLGDLELRNGELDAAEAHYRKALIVRPYASKGFKLVALARARAGQRDRAAALAAESAKRWPDDFEVQLLHALFLGAAGQRDQAQAAYEAARRLRPEDPALAGGLDATLARLLPTIQAGRALTPAPSPDPSRPPEQP
ncbi:MAG: tetratricopeptide repeat protein [Thermoanaerobaculia bacterium]